MDFVFRFLSFSFFLAWVCGVAFVFSVRRFHLVPDTYHTAWVVSFDTFCTDQVPDGPVSVCVRGRGVDGSGDEVLPEAMGCVCHLYVSGPVPDTAIHSTKKLAKQEVRTMGWVRVYCGGLSILL